MLNLGKETIQNYNLIQNITLFLPTNLLSFNSVGQYDLDNNYIKYVYFFLLYNEHVVYVIMHM